MPNILHTYSTIEELTKLTASIVSTMKPKTKAVMFTFDIKHLYKTSTV